jgi:hypothetical protein
MRKRETKSGDTEGNSRNNKRTHLGQVLRHSREKERDRRGEKDMNRAAAGGEAQLAREVEAQD